jgi:ectoine hydroxylase-related dioxygenase (phytanoyl-CoA dioxygenase family)
MKLTPQQCELLPSEEDVAFYEKHGYYVSKKIFADEEIDDAVYGSERYYAGERDFILPDSVKAFEGWKPGDGAGLRINDYPSLSNQELSALVRNPLIGAIAARLSRSRSIRLWHDQMIYKPPSKPGGKEVIGWHTDHAYWKTCTSTNMLTAWVPLHDCDEARGTLTVINGSHRWPGNNGLKGFHKSELERLEREFETASNPVIKVPLDLKKGQVSFHHCLTIHGSGLNLSDSPRLSLSVHLQDDANEYCESRHPNGEIVWHRNDMLCRTRGGKPDYSDPDFCPRLWS